MFWRRARQREFLPWYRDPNYKGDLKEAEKRELDALRTQPKHPAARYEDLPDEVQAYIARLEVEAYDAKQDNASISSISCTLFGVALLCFHYLGTPPTFWTWTCGLGLLIVPWFVYRHRWNKNAKEFFPDSGGTISPADEAIRKEWEVRNVGRSRSASVAR